MGTHIIVIRRFGLVLLLLAIAGCSTTSGSGPLPPPPTEKAFLPANSVRPPHIPGLRVDDQECAPGIPSCGAWIVNYRATTYSPSRISSFALKIFRKLPNATFLRPIHCRLAASTGRTSCLFVVQYENNARSIIATFIAYVSKSKTTSCRLEYSVSQA
jgi:hypothetical protein